MRSNGIENLPRFSTQPPEKACLHEASIYSLFFL